MVAILTIASFMEILDSGIANVALPKIAGNLSITPEEASLVTSSYLIANTIVVPIAGWLATYFGRKRLYLVCVGGFVVSSFMCGISTSLEMLVFFRVIQGLAGGNLVVLEQAFIIDRIPSEQRGTAFSIYGATIVCAPIFAPALGGWLTDTYSWHWVFFINVPIGILSIFLVSAYVSEPKSTEQEREEIRKTRRHIDLVGMLLITTCIATITIVLDKGNRDGWFESQFIVTLTVIALVTLVLGAAWELTHDDPAVDLRLLANRGVGAGAIVVFVVAVTIYGSSVLIPLFAQRMLGFTAHDSGMINTAGGLVSLVMIPVAGYLNKRIDARFLAVAGLCLASLAFWSLASLNLEAGYWDIALRRAFQTFAGAFLFTPVMAAAFRGVPKEKANAASSLVTTSAGLGGSFGIAILTTYLANRTTYHVTVLSEHATTYNPSYLAWLSRATRVLQDKGMAAVNIPEATREMLWSEIQRQAGMLAFIDTFLMTMLLTICAIPLVFLFRPKPKS